MLKLLLHLTDTFWEKVLQKYTFWEKVLQKYVLIYEKSGITKMCTL